LPEVLEVFISGAVAVIIFAVADFFGRGAWLCRALGTGFIIFALPFSGALTDAYTDAASLVFVGEVFIDLAIAIVIEVIAFFFDGFAGGAVDPLAFGAGFCARFARCRTGLGDIFIDVAITVIIDVVTCFCFGGTGFDGTFDTGLVAFASPFSGSFTGSDTNRAGFSFVAP
jgi:hypothetical protein